MATNDKEPTSNDKDGHTRSHTTREPKSLRLSGTTIGAAVVVAILLLLSGTAAGFIANRVLDHGMRGDGGAWMMHGGLRSGGFSTEEPNGGMRSHMARGTYGKVTNVSSSSITLTDERSGGSITFAINSNTDVNNSSGDNAKVSDIKVGDTVLVQGTSATDDTLADTIVINPSIRLY
jgi:hypothetical protein